MSDMKEQSNTLRHLVKCVVCGEKYHHNKTVVLEEGEVNTTFHLTCNKCNTSVLIFVSNNQQSVVSLGVATDMDNEEVLELFRSGVVSSDDVLSVYEHLKK